MKKVMSVALAILLVFSLNACGSKTPSAATAADTSKPGASASAGTPAGTSGGASPAPVSPTAGGTLKIVLQLEGAAPIGLPWGTATGDLQLTRPFLESLFYQTSATGEIKPNLADSWKLDEASSSLIVTLHPGIRFSDGSDFTADAAGWNLMMGVKAKTVSAHIVGYEAKNAVTLALKYDVWSNDILSSLSSAGMCSKASYEKNGEAWAKENPVGTGPFVMTEYIHGQSLKAKKNPNYWQPGKPYLDGIEYLFIRDQMTQTMALQTAGDKGIDVLNTNTAEQVVSLKQIPGLSILQIPAGSACLLPSSKNPASPLARLEVRQAIAYAIDRESIVKARGFGLFSPAVQFVSKNSLARLDDSFNVSYNLQKAKDLLAKAGYPNGFSTKIITQPGSTDREVAVILQKMLENIGIKAELEFPDAGGYTTLRSKGWEGLLFQALREFPRVVSMFNSYMDYNEIFMVGIARPVGWKEALSHAQETPDIDKAAVQACHKLVMDNLMAIPVYELVGNCIVKNTVHDTHLFEDERLNWLDTWVSKA